MRFQDLDLFRKLPVELTIGTKLGGALSLVTLSLLAILFLVEIWNAPSSTTESILALDEKRNDQVRFAFRVGIPEVPCRFIIVNFEDPLRAYSVDLDSKWLTKTVMAGSDTYLQQKSTGAGGTKMRLFDEQGRLVYSNDFEGLVSAAAKLDSDMSAINSFEGVLRQSQFTIVFFFVPWCAFCTQTLPIWEEFKNQMEKSKSYPSGTLSIIKIDCKEEATLCRKQKIMVVPTIRMYRGNDLMKPDYYSTKRTADLFVAFAKSKIDPALEKGGAKIAEEVSPWHNHEGCILSGLYVVSKGPGFFRISTMSNGSSFEPSHLNFSHVVESIKVSDEDDKNMLTKKNAPEIIADNIEPLDNTGYISTFFQGGMSFDHYLKIVPTTYKSKLRPAAQGYQITSGSHGFYKEHGMPELRITYDFSPLRLVFESRSTKQWYEFLANICAIVGGVFTVLNLTDQSIFAYVKRQQKLRQGKQG